MSWHADAIHTDQQCIELGIRMGLRGGTRAGYFWHWGENGLFANFAIGNPREGSGIVILTNGHHGLRVCERIVRGITGHDHAAFFWV
jgi:hypothetical protein